MIAPSTARQGASQLKFDPLYFTFLCRCIKVLPRVLMRRMSENQFKLSSALVSSAAARCCCPDFKQLLSHAEENLESLTQGTYWILPKA